MLLELRIANLALIREAELHGGRGFNVLTGETGAGKSILVSALGLLVGERAAAEHVGIGDARALVEGTFDISATPQAAAHLREAGIPCEDNLLLVAREISSDGSSRSRVRVNGRLATTTTLRELGALLVDLHGQHEHQLLLDPASHLGFLDAFGDAKHQELREVTAARFAQWSATAKRLDDLNTSEQQRAQRLDMLRFQADEIDAAEILDNEDEALSDERARLLNAEKLRSAAALCRDALLGGEEGGALSLGKISLKAARELEVFDKSVAPWAAQMESALLELDDAAREASRYAESLEADPARLDDIEARLHLLNRLKKKYGATLADVAAHRAAIGAELTELDLSSEELAVLEKRSELERAAFEETAAELSQSRRVLAEDFAARVVAELSDLAMEKARFAVRFAQETTAGPAGTDKVEFIFSANPGQPQRALTRIASGGEISRVMLAIRSVLAGAPQGGIRAGSRVPVLVFDEVDSGIGGVTAEAVGEKMRQLAREFQVFCVTHLPQIARRADRHYRVHKESDDRETRVAVTLLEGEERVRELARMMGNESEANLRHAQQMLEGSES